MSRNITRFEQLAYLGLMLAVVEAPLELLRATGEMQGTPTAISAAKIIAILGEFLGIGIGWLPIWLIARRGKYWARWLFLAVYVAALAFGVTNLGRAGRLFDFLNTLQAIFWTAALYFLFARDRQTGLELAPNAPLVEREAPIARTRVQAGRREVVAPGELKHRGKVDAHVAEMGRVGIAKYIAAPPLFRLLWASGLELPPPLFLGFVPTMLITGVPFAVVWALLNGFMKWVGIAIAFLVGICVSLLFGALVAAYYRHKLQRLSLPSWENYLPTREGVHK